ncbi:sigma-70 family RNA polymerase sigma factor [Paenibacillus albicereus]|uniref:Sigma-70 family RNA polymerase sigma factor n=1 Tax=Paenibacillus albicereus TaxID=2726185 RepID=A0A6H2GZ17_9BACL|nr:sigma-70 family RNA polymerase sigma factor [Paenibacillus albicereus]QJC52637.1 sigma-70 family RNA polymerase sigma factor [Paenibacillus albicereus]
MRRDKALFARLYQGWGRGAQTIRQDEAWLRAVRDSGTERFGEIIDEYGDYLYRTIYAILRSPHDTEDVLQEALIAISRALPECRLDGFKTWITRIAVNRAIDWKRSRARREEPAELGSDNEFISAAPWMEPGAEAEPIVEQLIEGERRREVRRKVSELPPEYRTMVRDFYFRRRTQEEISQEQGLRPKSVESKLYRARSWMRRHWRKEDFE